MIRPRLLCKPTPTATRLLLCDGEDEILKAMLPSPPQAHPRAAPTLCEGLALWLGRPLSIALYADTEGASSALGLCDGLGFGATSLFYQVDVVDPSRRHRPLGSFRDLRQLDLRGIR